VEVSNLRFCPKSRLERLPLIGEISNDVSGFWYNTADCGVLGSLNSKNKLEISLWITTYSLTLDPFSFVGA
jgi:hypothetical protein